MKTKTIEKTPKNTSRKTADKAQFGRFVETARRPSALAYVDTARAGLVVTGAVGKRLTYRQLVAINLAMHRHRCRRETSLQISRGPVALVFDVPAQISELGSTSLC